MSSNEINTGVGSQSSIPGNNSRHSGQNTSGTAPAPTRRCGLCGVPKLDAGALHPQQQQQPQHMEAVHAWTQHDGVEFCVACADRLAKMLRGGPVSHMEAAVAVLHAGKCKADLRAREEECAFLLTQLAASSNQCETLRSQLEASQRQRAVIEEAAARDVQARDAQELRVGASAAQHNVSRAEQRLQHGDVDGWRDTAATNGGVAAQQLAAATARAAQLERALLEANVIPAYQALCEEEEASAAAVLRQIASALAAADAAQREAADAKRARVAADRERLLGELNVMQGRLHALAKEKARGVVAPYLTAAAELIQSAARELHGRAVPQRRARRDDKNQQGDDDDDDDDDEHGGSLGAPPASHSVFNRAARFLWPAR
jgi:hypothetical protein